VLIIAGIKGPVVIRGPPVLPIVGRSGLTPTISVARLLVPIAGPETWGVTSMAPYERFNRLVAGLVVRLRSEPALSSTQEQ
jgi:hypothetical protein